MSTTKLQAYEYPTRRLTADQESIQKSQILPSLVQLNTGVMLLMALHLENRFAPIPEHIPKTILGELRGGNLLCARWNGIMYACCEPTTPTKILANWKDTELNCWDKSNVHMGPSFGRLSQNPDSSPFLQSYALFKEEGSTTKRQKTNIVAVSIYMLFFTLSRLKGLETGIRLRSLSKNYFHEPQYSDGMILESSPLLQKR